MGTSRRRVDRMDAIVNYTSNIDINSLHHHLITNNQTTVILVNNKTIHSFTSDAISHVTEKSFSLLGVIVGFVLLLLFLALVTCVRQKKIYQDFLHRQSLGMEPLRYYRVYCQLEGMSVSVCTIDNNNINIISDQDEPPPDYDSVIVADMDQLPNYADIVGD